MLINEGFIICSSDKKQEIIKEANGFKNYIFLSYNELRDKLLGSCENEALIALVKNYGISYEQAEEYIKYMPYIKSKKYLDFKLDSLASAKNYLLSNNLFKRDELFIYRLSQYPVTFIDLDDSNEHLMLINEVKKYTTVYQISSNSNKYDIDIYAYKTINDECIDVFNQIKKLNKSGISLNNIFIENVDDSYSFIFNRLSKHYNIPIVLPKRRNILATKIAKSFIELSNSLDSYADILEAIDKDSLYYNDIFNIIVDYNLEDKKPFDYISFFIHKFKNIAFKQNKYTEMVSTNPKNSYSEDDYVFFVGLNLGKAPRTYKDDGYLNDFELEALGLSTSILKNKISKAKLIKKLTSTKNIYISYNERSAKEELPSNIIKELNITPKRRKIEYGLSKNEDDLRLATAVSNLNKYKINDDALDKYDFSHIRLFTYNNHFNGLSDDQIQKYFKDKKPKFSYSSLKRFYACPFAYYCDKYLNLDDFETTMSSRLGTFSHAVLEDSYGKEFDFNKSVIKNTEKYAVNNKDRFFFTIMEPVLSSLIEFNRLHEDATEFTHFKREEHLIYENDNFILHGYVDKLLFTEIDNIIYAAIIDYKTGRDVVSLDNVYDGFNLQLPVYMYLLKNNKEFEHERIDIVGIYLQKVNIIPSDGTIDLEEQRNKKFRLEGYSSSNFNLLKMIDANYAKSDYIAGMATKKDGNFMSYAKTFSSLDVKELIDIVENLALDASRSLAYAAFDIRPVKIDGKNQSCTYCKYKDICNVKYEDFVEKKKRPFISEEEGWGL